MGNLGNTRYKEGFYIAVFVIGIIVAIVTSIFLPKESMIGLIANFVRYVAVVCSICGLIMAIAHNLSVKNPVTVNAYLKAGYVLSGIAVLVGLYCAYNFVLDLTGDVKSAVVPATNYKTEAKTIRGIGGVYYLEFSTDEGKVKFPISEGTYKKIGQSYALKISYYPNSMVISSIESSSGLEIVDDLVDEYNEGGLSGIINSLFKTEKSDNNTNKTNKKNNNNSDDSWGNWNEWDSWEEWDRMAP